MNDIPIAVVFLMVVIMLLGWAAIELIVWFIQLLVS